MSLAQIQNGDAVYAITVIRNDGSVPGVAVDTVFAKPGSMGMLVNTGYFEENPDETLYLVCFEDERGQLGPPVTCLEHEISPVSPFDH